MELLRRLLFVISIHMVMLFLLFIGYSLNILHFSWFIILIIIELGLSIHFYVNVIKPLASFNKALDQCVNRDIDSGEIFDNLTFDRKFIKKIKLLIEKSIKQKIRENSAIMFDKQAELTALQSQINPHFLCNTLESIRGQALIEDNIEIAKMVEALASFFRYSISRKGNFVTLRDELANIQNYMMIQRYRFNNRFSLEIYIDDEDLQAYDFLIPKLILQPVIENAIYHGLEEILEGGKVEIEIIVTDNNLIMTISDNGKGMDHKTLMELNNRIKSTKHYMEDNKNTLQRRNAGIALPNIHKRIQLLFGDDYGVNVYSTLSQGTDVEITIPANYERNV